MVTLTRPDSEGLGLSIAFEIVHRNHGTIAVDRCRIGGLHVTVAPPRARTGFGRSFRSLPAPHKIGVRPSLTEPCATSDIG